MPDDKSRSGESEPGRVSPGAQAEMAALRESEERYRLIVENANEAILVAQGGRFVFSNPAAESLFGYSAAEIAERSAERSLVDFIHEADRELVRSRHEGRFRGERPPNVYPFRIVSKSGETKWVEINAELFSWNREPAALCFLTDITERKRIEDALRESENRYRSIFRNKHVVMLVIDPETGAIRDANPAAVDFYGWSHEELTAMRIQEINTLPSEEIHENMRAAHLRRRGLFRFEHRLKNGKIRKVSVVNGPMEYAGPPLLFSIVHDVTEHVRTEDALRESENRHRIISMLSSDYFYALKVDHSGRISPEWISGYFERVTGFDSSRIESFEDWTSYIHPEDLPGLEHVVGSPPSERIVTNRYRFIRKDGSIRWLEDRIHPEWSETEHRVTRVYGTVLDITERKETEEALRKAERELKLIFDSVPAMIWQKDREGRYLQVNRKYCDTVGIRKERILGRTDHDFFPPDIAGKYICDDRETLRRGQSIFGMEERLSKPSGEYGWSLTDKRVYRDADGNIAGTIGFALDITERKEAEETIRDALREKEVLLREIHHRVKNNMQVIVSLLRMHSRKTDDANLKGVFADCRDRIDAMALIHQALYESDNLARIDFAAYLEKLCRHIGQAHGIADRSIRMTAETCDATLDMDRGVAVGMIIAELLSNAFKHAFAPGEGGNVSVRLISPERNAYELIVEDDGRGLPPDFDLRNPSSLGMRLAMAAVTRELGGSIRAENDGGARFAVRFGTGNPCRKTGGNQE